MKTANYNDILYAAAELAGRTRDKLPPSEATMLKAYFAADLQNVWNKQPWNDLIPYPFYAVAPNGRTFGLNEGNGNPLTGPGGLPALSGQVNTDGVAAAATVTTTTNHGLAVGMTVTIAGATHDVFNGTVTVASVPSVTQFTYAIAVQGSAFGDNGISVTVPVELGDILGVYTNDPSLTTKARPVGFELGSNVVILEESLALVYVEYMLPYPDLLAVADGSLEAYTVPAIFSTYLKFRGAGQLLNSDIAGSGTTYLSMAEANLLELVGRVKVPAWRAGIRVRNSGAKIVC